MTPVPQGAALLHWVSANSEYFTVRAPDRRPYDDIVKLPAKLQFEILFNIVILRSAQWFVKVDIS